MDLLTSGDISTIQTAMGDLWDTEGKTIATVVKEPSVAVGSMSEVFVPGFDKSATWNNFTPQPESRDFRILTVEKFPNASVNQVTTNDEKTQTISVKFEKAGRDYILDGRKTIHIIVDGRKYNVRGVESRVHIAGLEYYIFHLELTL